MNTAHTRIIIAGAGIGGLAVGAALNHHGFETEIFERADQVRGHGGSGLTVWGNAVAALGHIGLAGEIKAAGSPLERNIVITESGQQLITTDVGQVQRDVSDVGTGIRRQKLLDILHDAAGRDRVTFENPVTGYRDAGDEVIVEFGDGSERAADILIGADGLRSTVREKMLGKDSPSPQGHMVWRGISESGGTFPAETVLMVYGPQATRMVAWPVAKNNICWSIARNGKPARNDLTPDELKQTLQGFIAGFPESNQHILATTPAERLLRTDLFAWRTVERLVTGRVALLGDAAHAMPTVFGQGACMAIEDSVVLAQALSANPADPAAALARYEAVRMPRLTWVREQIFKMSSYQEWESPLLCSMRNMFMRSMGSGRQDDMWRRLLAFEPAPASGRAHVG